MRGSVFAWEAVELGLEVLEGKGDGKGGCVGEEEVCCGLEI